MVFEKYRARKAYAKELRSISITELELEHKKLRNPFPPSYDDLYRDIEAPASPSSSISSPSSFASSPSSSRSSVSSGNGGSATSSAQSSRSASPYGYIPNGGQQGRGLRRPGISSSSSSNRNSYASSSSNGSYTMTTATAGTASATTSAIGTIERPLSHSRSGSDASTRS